MVTSTREYADCAGGAAVIDSSELTVKFGAATDPNMTLVAPENPVPAIETIKLSGAPDAGPLFGDRDVTFGVVILKASVNR
jgi:hypothetical protein